MLKVLADQFQTRYLVREEMNADPEAVNAVPRPLAVEHRIMPLEMRAGILVIALSNPLDTWSVQVLQDRLRLQEVEFVIAKQEDILSSIHKYYGDRDLNGNGSS